MSELLLSLPSSFGIGPKQLADLRSQRLRARSQQLIKVLALRVDAAAEPVVDGANEVAVGASLCAEHELLDVLVMAGLAFDQRAVQLLEALDLGVNLGPALRGVTSEQKKRDQCRAR